MRFIEFLLKDSVIEPLDTEVSRISYGLNGISEPWNELTFKVDMIGSDVVGSFQRSAIEEIMAEITDH